MYLLTFWVEHVPQPFQLRFTDLDRAMAVLTGFRETTAGRELDMIDDFNCHITIPRSRTFGIAFTDVSRDIEAQSEIQLIQHRAQVALQAKVASDPVVGLHQNRPGLVRAQ